MTDVVSLRPERHCSSAAISRISTAVGLPLLGLKAAKWLMPFCLLFLSACTVCPPSRDNWSGDIPAQPEEQSINIEQASDNSKEGLWSWQDGPGRWLYSAREKPDAPGNQWVYEPNAIVLRVNAADQLNSYMGQPHTLSLKVIQLTNPAIVSELRQSPFGLSDLMAAKGKDLSANIVREDILVVAPGSTRQLVLDREQGVRYLALVAGYFEMESKKSVRIIPIPSVQARILPCYDTTPWPFGEPPPPQPDDLPARLKLWLDMSSSEIEELQVQAY
ncbi:type VI secretion system lipoprotein TssJ [Oceanospirillum linum]|uniref:type VI secretion system lipoprotein TssJ n=1 Tax=Oceanospirillum linum TaxID=966 RepID=UPI00089F548C|nr:type VI secretion system lipoprotein TssJ [Oceanospirillum linum]SEG12853.1 type VI secretion lipoprotein, VC_A0113 family [Oleiphilus messinensis]SMP09919.1 type VI secretion lipoprotein, VC_A0113 family [Oceanospirillum linum]